MLKKKKIIVISVMSALLIATGVSLCAGFANDNNKAFQKLEQSFSDVKETDWFYDDVGYTSGKGLMQGTSDTLFAPDNPTTRGMLVTILWRLDGEPVENGNAFLDVESDTYYYDAVAWTSKCGIVKGYSDTVFSPNDNITREQLASILYRYAEYKKYDISKTSELSEYIDKNQISDYAVSAMQWANANGIITGTTEDTLSPQGNALRCQIAAILKRFCEKIIPSNTDNETKDEHSATEQPKDDKTSSGNKGENISANGNSVSSSETENNTGYPLISINDVSAKAGDEIRVSITLKNNPGILGMALATYYDEEKLTLQSVENGEAFKDILELTTSQTLASGSRFLWDGIDISENDIKDGTVLIMNFKINNGAQAGKYPITLKYSDGDIVDKNLISVSPQIENGYITIND